MNKCFLCGNECEIQRDGCRKGGCDFYSCSNCGKYYTIDFFLDSYKNLIEDNKHIIAGYLFETNRKSTRVVDLTNDEIERILKSEKIPRTSMQKLEKLLTYFYDKNICIRQIHEIHDGTILSPVAYARSENEIVGMLISLYELGWIANYENDVLGNITFILTVKGLSHAEQLLSTSYNSSKVFIATQFRPVEGYAFPYTEVRDNAIKPAVEAASNSKLRAFTVDEEEHNEYITDKMIAEIRTSRFLIADLTHNNNGAYWEAGFAKGLGKEVIYICNQDWLDASNKLHFDIEQVSCIRWRTLDELTEKLINRIRATIM